MTDLSYQAEIAGLLASRYSLRFVNGLAPAWQVRRNKDFVVGDYTLAAYGCFAGELALARLRQLQKMEREMA